MRSILVLTSVVVAYVLLRGFPEAWPGLVRACVAVLSLFAGLGIWVRRPDPDGEMVASRRPVRFVDYLVLGAVVLAIEGLFLCFFSVAPAPLAAAAASFEAWLRPKAAEQRKLEASEADQARSGNWLWNDRKRRPLPKRTNYKPGNRPEVFLRANGDPTPMLSQRLYVQAFALGAYEDGAWTLVDERSRDMVAGNDGWIRLEEDRKGSAIECRVYHGEDPAGQNPVVGLQGLAAVRLPTLEELGPGLRLLPAPGNDGYEYDTLSKSWRLDELAGEDVGTPVDYPESLTELPEGIVGLRIRDLASVVQGEGSPIQKLQRIRSHLRTTLDYSLVTENPDDLDPLDNFLFLEQRGHCEFFATAGAMLARAAGIPSRVCYGWSGGTYYESSRLFVFRAREAHAWAEVLIDGYGWVVLDPTPPAALRGQRPELANPDESPPGMDETFEEADLAGLGWVRWVTGLTALILVPLLALFLARGRSRGLGESGPESGGDKLPYWGVFLEGCRSRGLRKGPGTTLRSLLDLLDEPPRFANELVRYHYGVRYEGRARDPSLERRLAKSLREWASQLRE